MLQIIIWVFWKSSYVASAYVRMLEWARLDTSLMIEWEAQEANKLYQRLYFMSYEVVYGKNILQPAACGRM